ncbi:hypothetical protein EFK50_07880 [Nocardioides marmoriginsengisoli]|uniref:Uncharacterized protein n=2 Tax=Nocardioides marmoriginsengisoli TaxID=661483 RepID=A0A3N0CL54_9ACTN|nr:hypothetical protein EFK50_07880 [Nocardioides marmoriginsengisoli]
MVKAAAAAALLDRELNSLSKDSVQAQRTTRELEKGIDKVGRTSGTSGREVDRLSGRIRLLGDAFTVLLPTVAPIGSVGVAAIAGLSSEIGFATIAAGTAVLAFQGIGDTLKAVNKAALEPTEANLTAARIAMESLTPAAQDFVREIRAMQPELSRLKALAATNLFPGLTAGLHELEGTLPAVEKIIGAIAAELGSIAEDAGASLASERWMPFFEFIATEAPPALSDLASAIGNTTHAFAELWMAFTPLNRSFADWLVSSTADLDRWAAGLSETQGFREFVAYIQRTGPQLQETIGAIANAFLQIIEAAAPLAGPVLETLTALSNVVAAIAGSDLGTPIYTAVAAMVIFNRTMQASEAGVARLKGGFANFSTGAKLGAVVLGLEAIDMAVDSIFDKQLDGSNLGRSLEALAAGNVVGEIKDKFGKDLKGLVDELGLATGGGLDAINRKASSVPVLGTLFDLPSKLTGGTGYKTAVDNVKQLDQALAGLVDSGQADAAKAIVDQILEAGASSSDVANGFKQYGLAVENATGKSADFTLQAEKQSQAVLAQKQAAHETASSFLEFGASLSDSKVSLDDWIKELEDQAAALRDFTANAKEAGEKGLRQGLIKELEAAGPAGALRMRELANATEAEIRRANRAWRSGRLAIKEYEDFKLTPKTPQINVTPAMSALDRLVKKYNNSTIAFRAVVRGVGGIPKGDQGNPLFVDQTPADGATVLGPRFPYADKTLILAAPGEEVISNRHGQADRHRGLLKAINADRLAGGGTVGNRPALNAYIRDDLDMKFPSTLKQWNKAIAASTKLLEKESSKRQALLDQAQSVRDSISSNYKSDLFGKTDSSVWMSAADRMKAGKGDVFSTLTGDIGNLTSLKGAIGQLKSKGLDSDALAYLLSEGSLQDVQNFATGPKADVAKYESLFNQRDRLSVEVGNAGASAAFGPQLAVAKAQYLEAKKMTAALTRVGNLLEKNPNATGAAIARAINGVGPKRPKGKR